ncbi:hypothetical protein GWK47_005548 [Chionoecetes opilio]|uniref:Fibronectin type-III domain-containing protein n=1 Tax=Chionoecetes opilio TaxID=41210 RepID=A0A8J4Y9S3_CHIOP|nr:hypothetical protein GWK47_005548 [Chionoecetes opilio]
MGMWHATLKQILRTGLYLWRRPRERPQGLYLGQVGASCRELLGIGKEPAWRIARGDPQECRRRPILCQTPDCSFDSSETCGIVTPCSETTTIISGGNFTAPTIELVTGPEDVTNLTLNIDLGVQHITWNNPPKDSSPCHTQTAVRFTLKGKSTTTNHSVEDEHQNTELCRKEGGGTVEVWTEGGDGKSYVVLRPFYSNSASVVDLVEVSSCESLGCTSLLASWDYLPVCSAVTSFEVGLDYYDDVHPVDVDATNITITELPPSVSYELCVRAVDDHGDYIDSSCQTCYSPAAYVKNVQSVALTARSMRVTWDPPLCSVTDIAHNIKYSSESSNAWTSSYDDNSEKLEYLNSFQYTVCVEVGGGVDEPVCITAFTKLRQPFSVETSNPSADSRNLSWYFDEDRYPGFTITYQVTWGPNLQYKGQTQEKSFTIKNYTVTSPNGERFCVAAFPDTKLELMSEPYCAYAYGPTDGHGNGSSLGLIIGLSVSGAIMSSCCWWWL